MFVFQTAFMRYVFVLLFVLIIKGINAQVVSGRVADLKNKALPGISISIKGSYDGATSDSAGRFSFTTTEKGTQILTATGIGFRPFELEINLNNTNAPIAITLKEEVTELKAVVITAGSFEASDKKKATVLSTIDILTTASANADVSAAVKTLPGTQQVGESEGLFVRGGTAAETRTYIDGNLVNNFFYSSVPDIAQRGRFSPWIFKGTVFSAGGYSALYGQALSSALILESIDLPETSAANAGISIIGLSGGLQKLAANKKSSWGFSYGYTNIAIAFAMLKMKPDYFHIPEYHTGDLNFRIKTSRTGMLKYYGYFSRNKLGVRNASIDTTGYMDAFRLENFNMYHNISFKESINATWKFNGGISYTNNHDGINGALENNEGQATNITPLEFKNFDLDASGNYLNAKAVFEKRLKGISALRFGSEYNFTSDKTDYFAHNGLKYPSRLESSITAAFAEVDMYVTNNLAAKAGARSEYSTLIEKWNIAPRISIAYKLDQQSQASLAYGIFYQDPEKRYLPSPALLTFSKATHYIAQFQRSTAKQIFRAELFYKKYDDLLKTSGANNIAISNNGYGEAKGIEFFWRDRAAIKNFDYWISYSYLDTKRDYLSYPTALSPSFAAKHTSSLVMKKFITKMKTQFNASYTYASGRPYYNIRNISGDYKILDRGKTIDYNSLSFSVNYLPNVFKKGAAKYSVFVFSITNVLGSNQVYGYRYSFNNMRKEAIVPPSKRFIFLGAFLNFGVDRRQEVINNNL